MHIKEKLERIVNYYQRNRQAGHTLAMLEGANSNLSKPALLFATISSAQQILGASFKERKVVTLESLDKLEGGKHPLLVDNFALLSLCAEALAEIRKQEAKNKRLLESIKGLLSLE